MLAVMPTQFTQLYAAKYNDDNYNMHTKWNKLHEYTE